MGGKKYFFVIHCVKDVCFSLLFIVAIKTDFRFLYVAGGNGRFLAEHRWLAV
jgi:hypothetical protein